jgi:hypothetical protein
MKVYLREGIKPRDFLNWLLETGVEVDLFQRATSPLEDIYVKVVEESRIDQGKEPKGAE